jgi:hypothetical protein
MLRRSKTKGALGCAGGSAANVNGSRIRCTSSPLHAKGVRLMQFAPVSWLGETSLATTFPSRARDSGRSSSSPSTSEVESPYSCAAARDSHPLPSTAQGWAERANQFRLAKIVSKIFDATKIYPLADRMSIANVSSAIRFIAYRG